ncbi:MAG TPA: PhzF family phenazine biosynthesis protein [Candidatus Limnocylindrales bacterium]|nr:PhzF family phenazine biosynthesis protein [Candidatus Limnocylindrales bacterium]
MFGERPLLGNPLAVVLDGDGLDDGEMAAFARWTNLSETTFVLPPTTARPADTAAGATIAATDTTAEDPATADYRVRIFTPTGELPFAGHPTLGTCHAWLEGGGSPRPRDPDEIVQECAAGLVRIRLIDRRLAFAAPPLVRSGPADEELVVHLAELLRIDRGAIVAAEWVDNGPGWVGVLLGSAEEVLALRPGVVDLDVGVVGPYPPGSPQAVEVRAFMPMGGATAEDPVTGSLNASLAEWLLGTGRLTAPYVASQGAALRRAGRVHVTQDGDGTIWVGGTTTTVVEGEVTWRRGVPEPRRDAQELDR